jgi:hypothetical protein
MAEAWTSIYRGGLKQKLYKERTTLREPDLGGGTFSWMKLQTPSNGLGFHIRNESGTAALEVSHDEDPRTNLRPSYYSLDATTGNRPDRTIDYVPRFVWVRQQEANQVVYWEVIDEDTGEEEVD